MTMHSIQAKYVFLVYTSTRVTCRKTLLNNSDDQPAFHFTDLFSLSMLLRFFVYPTCEVLRKMEETIRMQILAYFVSLRVLPL